MTCHYRIQSKKLNNRREKTIANNSIELDTPLSKHNLNFLEVKRLKEEGHTIKSIHRQTGVHRQTIKKYLKYEEYPDRVSVSTYSIEIRNYEEHIQKRWKEGERNGKQLWREIQGQGYTGSFQSVYRLINRTRKTRKKKNFLHS